MAVSAIYHVNMVTTITRLEEKKKAGRKYNFKTRSNAPSRYDHLLVMHNNKHALAVYLGKDIHLKKLYDLTNGSMQIIQLYSTRVNEGLPEI